MMINLSAKWIFCTCPRS